MEVSIEELIDIGQYFGHGVAKHFVIPPKQDRISIIQAAMTAWEAEMEENEEANIRISPIQPFGWENGYLYYYIGSWFRFRYFFGSAMWKFELSDSASEQGAGEKIAEYYDFDPSQFEADWASASKQFDDSSCGLLAVLGDEDYEARGEYVWLTENLGT